MKRKEILCSSNLVITNFSLNSIIFSKKQNLYKKQCYYWIHDHCFSTSNFRHQMSAVLIEIANCCNWLKKYYEFQNGPKFPWKFHFCFENIGNFRSFSTFLPQLNISIVRLCLPFSAGQKEPKPDCPAENRIVRLKSGRVATLIGIWRDRPSNSN